MLIDKRYQIFLSSTYEDLREARQAATQSILAMGHLAAGMELFPASDLSQIDLIKRVIDESDYYIVIVSGKYGSVHPETGISFTEIEYDYAVSKGIPVLGFVIKAPELLLEKYCEIDSQKRDRLAAFREKVLSRTCKLFEDPSDLGLKVMHSLMTETRINPQLGWVRADQARNAEDADRERELLAEISKQKDEIGRLQRGLRDSVAEIPDITGRLASGLDEVELTVRFQSQNKTVVLKKCIMTWDEIFSAIGSSMFGYIVRRYSSANGFTMDEYPFEGNLRELIRTKIFDEVGQRNLYLFPNEIDAIMIQFKQLGYIMMSENRDEKENFRGFELTELGEQKLARLAVSVST